MLSEEQYELLESLLENCYPNSQVRLRINELEFRLRGLVIKSNFKIICVKVINGEEYRMISGINDPYEIICNTKIVKSFFNKQKTKLSKKQFKRLSDELTEEMKKDSIYKTPIWRNTSKFIAHLKKLEKAGNKIEIY